MQLTLRPAIERGRQYAFPAAWAAVLATGVAFYKPLPSLDVAPYLSFGASAAPMLTKPEQPPFLVPGCRTRRPHVRAARGERAG